MGTFTFNKISRTSLVLFLICVAGLLLNFWAFTPGFITSDGIDQYTQALTGEYHDWHPPAMALLWHFLLHIHKGMEPILFFQLMCLWMGVFYLADTFHSKRWYVMSFLLPVLPIVQNFAGYVGKDVHLTFTWFFAVSMLFHALIKHRKLNFFECLLSAFLIAYGTWVRINAMPGTIVLCFLWCYVVFGKASNAKRYLYTFLFVMLIIAGQKMIAVYTNATRTYPENKLFQHDFAGIYVRTLDNTIYPAELFSNPEFDTAYIRKNYHSSTYDMIWWNPDNKKINVGATDSTIAIRKKAWLAAIKKHPAAYLAHRYDGFLYYLRLKYRSPFTTYTDIITSNDYGWVVSRNRIQEVLMYYVIRNDQGFFMMPWFWILYNIVLFAFIPIIKNKNIRLVFTMLVLSSILYELPSFFIFQVDDTFRYFYWTCIACTMATILLVGDLFKVYSRGAATNKK